MHYVPELLSAQGIELDLLFPPSVTTTEKPLSKLLNLGPSQWTGSVPVVVLRGFTEQLRSVSLKRGVTENEYLRICASLQRVNKVKKA